MIVSAPQQLFRALQTGFNEGLASTSPALVGSIATYVASDGNKEDYSWIGDSPALEEFVDQVAYSGLEETGSTARGSDGRGFEAVNKKYTAGLEFKRDDLMDEKTGGMSLRIRDLGVRAAQKPDDLLVDLLIAGTATASYDGSYLFTATHAAKGNSGVQSNLYTGTGTSTAQVAADAGGAIAMLLNMKDTAGLPTVNRGFRQFFVLYPPALNKPTSEAIAAAVVSQTSNVQFNKRNIMMIEEPLLTADSEVDFYVGIMDAPMRGLIWQEREGPSLESQETGDDAFDSEVWKYKARIRGKAIPGRWERIVKVNN